MYRNTPLFFRDQLGRSVRGVAGKETSGKYPVKISPEFSVELESGEVEVAVRANFEELKRLAEQHGLWKYTIEADLELFVPASKVFRPLGGDKSYCYAFHVQLTGSNPPLAVVAKDGDCTKLEVTRTSNFWHVDEFFAKFKKSPYVVSCEGRELYPVELRKDSGRLFPVRPNHKDLMPVNPSLAPKEVKRTGLPRVLFAGTALVWESDGGLPCAAKPAKEAAKRAKEAAPEAKREAAPEAKRAKVEPKPEAQGPSAFEMLAQVAEDRYAEGIKAGIFAIFATPRGKLALDQTLPFVGSAAELVDLIYNAGASLTIDLVEAECHKIKVESETMARNLADSHQDLARTEARLAFLLGQAMPFQGRGIVADQVRVIAAGNTSMAATAQSVDTYWRGGPEVLATLSRPPPLVRCTARAVSTPPFLAPLGIEPLEGPFALDGPYAAF